MNHIVLAHLKINSLRNKLDLLADQIKGNVDVLAILETKLDDSVPVGQFEIPGYASSFRLDRKQNGGTILAYVRQDIPVKVFPKRNLLELFPLNLIFIKRNGLCVVLITQTNPISPDI